ncbi:hypothetical protein C8F01DRAFT_946443, partial [Mycena amicta]
DEDHEGVEHAPIDAYDDVFGDGEDMASFDTPGDAALGSVEAKCLGKFDAALDAIKISTCRICCEEGFQPVKTSGDCNRCHSDRNDVKLWSDENHVNP